MQTGKTPLVILLQLLLLCASFVVPRPDFSSSSVVVLVAENRLKPSADRSDSPSSFVRDQVDLSLPSDRILFRAAQHADNDQLDKFLKLGANPNGQLSDGTTALHFATENGHVE